MSNLKYLTEFQYTVCNFLIPFTNNPNYPHIQKAVTTLNRIIHLLKAVPYSLVLYYLLCNVNYLPTGGH